MPPYRIGPGWDDLYRFFERGNAAVFERAWKFIQTGKPVWEEPKGRKLEAAGSDLWAFAAANAF